MTIIEALLGEHGAIYPLLERIEITAPSTDLSGLKIQASLLQSTLISHANLEDELLRPAILPYLPRPCLTGDGRPLPSDHEVIGSGLGLVLAAVEVREARRCLLETVAKTRKHFLKEETIIFGISRRELPQLQQLELAAEWARRRGVSVT
jgi:hypothetical protein